MDTICKPMEASGNNYTEIVKEIEKVLIKKAEEGYTTDFAVGVSFGADLSKWREILSVAFPGGKNENKTFNELMRFNEALLITDPVYIKDRNCSEAISSDKLRIQFRGKSDKYLHSKLILFKLVNDTNETKFVLFVGSKNISYSNSFDMFVPLYGKSGEKSGNDTDDANGANVYDYLQFLIKETDNEDVLEKLSCLKDVSFDVENNDGEYEAHISDICFSYEGHPFSDDFWDRVLRSPLVISPYLDEKQVKDWLNSGKEAKKKKLLTYRYSADKINSIINQNGSPVAVFVGEGSGDNKVYKYHTKLYVSVGDDGNTNVKIL